MITTSIPVYDLETRRIHWRFGTSTAEAAPPTPFDSPEGLPASLQVTRQTQPRSVDEVVDGLVTITYQVQNRRPEVLDAVLLRTSLAPGVSYDSASPPADRVGSELAFQLGRIEPGQRARVELEVSITAPFRPCWTRARTPRASSLALR